MDFSLSDEHKMVRVMARQFAEEMIALRGVEMERTGEYPYNILDQTAPLDMMGILFPEEYGGCGGDWIGMNRCIEEIARNDITVGASLEVTSSVVEEELFGFGTKT